MSGRRADAGVAVVTGASSGIGNATARRLAAAGFTIAAIGRRADRLDALCTEILSAGGVAVAVPVDITNEGDATVGVERVIDHCGRIDVLINNAGLMLLGDAESSDRADWQRMVDLNISGMLNMTYAALPHLREAAHGFRSVADIVNVSSVAGTTRHGGQAVYALTKAGVDAFSESLRKELAEHSVRVHTIVPGATRTELSSHNSSSSIGAAARERMRGVTHLDADDVADTISYVTTRPSNVCIGEVVIRPTGQV